MDEIKKIEKIKEKIIDVSSIDEIKRIVLEEFQKAIPVEFLSLEINKEPPSFKGNIINFGMGDWKGYFAFGGRLSEEPFSKEERNAINSLVKQIEKSVGYIFLQNSLIEKEKLAMLGTFSSIIAHEIKNPLNGMKLIVSFLSQKYGESEEYKILLKEIERLNKILNDVLDWHREVKLEKNSFEIYDFINQIENLIFPILEEKNISFILERPEENFYLNADFEKLKQVFLNLTQNSIKALEGRKGEIKIKIFKEDNKCHFYFEDNGKGIGEEELLKIFEPFSSFTGSTGLGLFVVKKIIDAHNGKIEVSSIKNTKTRFDIWIPC